jgi:pyruvate dehydrogenase E1 component alpha subunit
MLAEIYGKKTGCAGGRGGSMHLIDEAAGFKGSTAIVGNTIPIGVGLGYSICLKGTDQVSCIYFGDGAIETGVFYESANFAAVKKLPVLFVCENNFYSVYSPLRVRQPAGREIYKLATAIGMSAEQGDGNDAEAVYLTARDALRKVRAGNGPHFLEFITYRWREHCGPNFDNHIGYRSEQEYLHWRTLEPIGRLEAALIAAGHVTAEAVIRMDDDIRRETDEAFRFADESPFPEPNDAYTRLFA